MCNITPFCRHYDEHLAAHRSPQLPCSKTTSREQVQLSQDGRCEGWSPGLSSASSTPPWLVPGSPCCGASSILPHRALCSQKPKDFSHMCTFVPRSIISSPTTNICYFMLFVVQWQQNLSPTTPAESQHPRTRPESRHVVRTRTQKGANIRTGVQICEP